MRGQTQTKKSNIKVINIWQSYILIKYVLLIRSDMRNHRAQFPDRIEDGLIAGRNHCIQTQKSMGKLLVQNEVYIYFISGHLLQQTEGVIIKRVLFAHHNHCFGPVLRPISFLLPRISSIPEKVTLFNELLIEQYGTGKRIRLSFAIS